MATAAQLQSEMDAVFALMGTLRDAGPEASVTGPNGRSYTLKNLDELQRQYDWLEKKLAAAQRASARATAAGGGAAVIEFGGPTA
ncbi:MAG TPA: hypothetical protein VMW52_11760 [Phycisphaerae bacterium]|nr:hypothetical protein [Phycisphaerae bacterium]